MLNVALPVEGGVAAGRPPSDPTCARARRYLEDLTRGSASDDTGELWGALAPHGAVAGSKEAPTITEVGRQVLRELELRAYRVDERPLARVALEIGEAMAGLSRLADRAEYFIAELGPVPPVQSLPRVRIVASCLASRPESSEDLVENFKNAWGSMEVLGASPFDRLLAAHLVAASGVPQESFYAALSTTVDRLQAEGCQSPLSTSALLHLFPATTLTPPVPAWKEARKRMRSDLEAAMVASGPHAANALARWDRIRARLKGSDRETSRAATYLVAREEDDPNLIDHIVSIAKELEGRWKEPLLVGALLRRRSEFSVAELLDWLSKSEKVAQSRQLAPTRQELDVISLAFVQALVSSPSVGGKTPPAIPSLAAHVALHAWMYGDVTKSPGTPSS